MTPWLSVIGIGENGLAGLTPAARTLVDTAEVLIGGARHLAMLPAPARQGDEGANNAGQERLSWTTPITDTVEQIAARRGRRVTVLATGDPMHYGIGVTLLRHFAGEEMTVIPSLGVFTLAAARMGWPLAETETLTLHGRPIAMLDLHLAPGQRLLVMSHDGDTPTNVAARLCERRYGPSTMTVLEHMSGREEHRIDSTAADWGNRRTADLNTVAIRCLSEADAQILPRTPGLPDEAFLHDGQLTKREVRAATLAALVPLPDQHLWDVGAGAGSVAIEWMRSARGTRAVTIEKSPARAARIAQNASALGTPDLEIVTGHAPGALAELESPDAVFIGGGLTETDLPETCWRSLKAGGRLVANSVTTEGEAVLLRLRSDIGGTLTRIAVSRAEPTGSFTGWKPLAPVTQLTVMKR